MVLSSSLRECRREKMTLLRLRENIQLIDHKPRLKVTFASKNCMSRFSANRAGFCASETSTAHVWNCDNIEEISITASVARIVRSMFVCRRVTTAILWMVPRIAGKLLKNRDDLNHPPRLRRQMDRCAARTAARKGKPKVVIICSPVDFRNPLDASSSL